MPDGNDLFQLDGVNFQLAQVKVAVVVQTDHMPQDQDAGNPLRRGGRDSDSERAKPEHDHHDKIQADVDRARNRQEHERMGGVACGTEHGGAVVINHIRGRADEIGAHIGNCLIQHRRLCSHQGQERAGEEKADNRDDRTAEHGGENRGMNRLSDLVILPRAQFLRHADARADRQPEKQIDNQVDERAARSDRRKRRLSGFFGLSAPTPHHNGVRRVEQELKDSGCDQWEREKNDFGKQCARGQVAIRFDGFG